MPGSPARRDWGITIACCFKPLNLGEIYCVAIDNKCSNTNLLPEGGHSLAMRICWPQKRQPRRALEFVSPGGVNPGVMEVDGWMSQLPHPWGTVLRCVLCSLLEDPGGAEPLSSWREPLHSKSLLTFFPSLSYFPYCSPSSVGSPPKQTTNIQILFQDL